MPPPITLLSTAAGAAPPPLLNTSTPRPQENATRPEGLPPSQGGKFVGFGSGPPPSAPQRRGGSGAGVDDVTHMLSRTVMGVTSSVGAAARTASNAVSDGRVVETAQHTASVVATKGGAAFNSLWSMSKKALVSVASSVETVARDNGYKIDLGSRELERNASSSNGGGAGPASGSSGRYGGFGSDSLGQQQQEGPCERDSWGGSNGGGGGYGSDRRAPPASTSTRGGGDGSFSGFDDAAGGGGGGEGEWGGSWDSKPATSKSPSRVSPAAPRPSSRTSGGSGGSRRGGMASSGSNGGGKAWDQWGDEPVTAPKDDEWGKW